MNRLHWTFLLMIVGGASLGTTFFLGSNDPKPAAEETFVFVCSETGELVVASRQETPAVNPKTNRRTMLRALHCAECNRWYATKPSASFEGNPLHTRCPTHKRALSSTGPL